MKHLKLGALAASGLIGLAAPAMAQTVLKFAHFVPPAHSITEAVVTPLTEGVAAKSNGEVTIQTYPGGELGPGPIEQYERAINGTADIVWGLSGYTSAQFPLTMIAELPGVVDGKGDGYKRLWAAMDDLKGEFPGTKPLVLWVSEPNVLIMGDKDIKTPDDIKGLKIRVSGAVPGKVIESLGATPVQMPANEMYNALDTGLIDGILTGSSAIHDFKLNEVADSYTTGAALGNIVFYVVMNEATYEGLSDAGKAAIDETAGEALSANAEAVWNRVGGEELERLRADPAKRVFDLTEAEAKPFNDVTLAIRDNVIAELEGQGLPAEAVLGKMSGM